MRDLDRIEEAAECAETALRLRGMEPHLATNFASIRTSQGRFEEALQLLDEALRMQPDWSAAHINRAHVLLLQGKFEEGWKEYEWRPKRALDPGREYNGQFLNGKTLLMHHEQGLGDLIQFVRYAAPLAEQGANVVVSCDAKLIPLMKCARGVAGAVDWRDPAPAFDYEVNMMSLPRLTGWDGGGVAYVDVDAGLVADWAERLRAEPRYRVGLFWGGNPANPVQRFRGVGLAKLERLLRNRKVAFYSLQLGPQRADLAMLPPDLTVVDLQNDCLGIMDVAAAMMNLDLVISTDTMPVHLAGALGRPVWVLLSYSADWRWMLERQDSPLYASMRLFRQSRRGDWNDPITRLAEELERQVQ